MGVRPTGFEAAASHGGGGHNHHHHGGGGGGGEGKCSYEGGGGGDGPTVTAAVQVEAGRCQLRGCVITDNQGFGVLVGSQGYVEIEHCDVSFNRESGLWWDAQYTFPSATHTSHVHFLYSVKSYSTFLHLPLKFFPVRLPGDSTRYVLLWPLRVRPCAEGCAGEGGC